MKKPVLVCLLLIFILSEQTIKAQVVQRDLLTKAFSLADIKQYLIPQNKWKPFPLQVAEWAKQVPDSVRQSIIKLAEEYKDRPFTSIPASVTLEYVRNGNRVNYERLSFDKRNRLFTLVLAESMENKKRFTDAIVNGVWNICEETYWGVTAHIGSQRRGSGLPDVSDPTVDLFGAETAAVLALTDYFTGPKLDSISPLIRERITIEVNRKILNSYENEVARYGYFGNGKRTAKVNNWDPWVVSNCMTAFLLLEKNEERRAKLMVQSMSLLDLYINGLGEDGATDEGPSYWFAAGLALFDGLTMLADATNQKVTVFNHPLIKQLGSYIYQTHIDGEYFVNVADATPKIKADGVGIYRFGKAVNDKEMMHFGSWAYHHIQDNTPKVESFFKPRQLYNLAATAEVASAPQSESKLPSMYLPSVELMTARTNNELFIASHGGNNAESHNHNDVGDFIIYADGAPVIIDAGKGTYMAITFSRDRYKLWYNTSPYHNVPLVNGIEQEANGNAKANNVSFNTSNSLTTFTMNLEKAYPEKAGIKLWNRNIVVDHQKNTIKVKDSYQLTDNPQLTQTFMTVCDTEIDTPGKIVFTTEKNQKVQLVYDATDWKATKEKMALTEPHEQGLKANWNNKSVWRILLTNVSHKKIGEFGYSISKL
ncbi:MAG: heparinase II/III family protein [Bacteroidota bacterium]